MTSGKAAMTETGDFMGDSSNFLDANRDIWW